MEPQQRRIDVPAVLGTIIVTVSAAVMVFAVGLVTLEGYFPDLWFGSLLSAAFLAALGGAVLMARAPRVESDRSLLPATVALGGGGSLGGLVGMIAYGLSPVWLGVALLLTLGFTVAWRVRERRTRRLLEAGRRVDAVFTDVHGSEADGTSAYESVRYTVAYADEEGTSRTASGEKSFPSSRLPRPGDRLTLWYDPRRPSRHLIRLADEDG